MVSLGVCQLLGEAEKQLTSVHNQVSALRLVTGRSVNQCVSVSAQYEFTICSVLPPPPDSILRLCAVNALVASQCLGVHNCQIAQRPARMMLSWMRAARVGSRIAQHVLVAVLCSMCC